MRVKRLCRSMREKDKSEWSEKGEKERQLWLILNVAR
jgi:hypothetical protein